MVTEPNHPGRVSGPGLARPADPPPGKFSFIKVKRSMLNVTLCFSAFTPDRECPAREQDVPIDNSVQIIAGSNTISRFPTFFIHVERFETRAA